MAAQRERRERAARAQMDWRGYQAAKGARIRAGAFRHPKGMGRRHG